MTEEDEQVKKFIDFLDDDDALDKILGIVKKTNKFLKNEIAELKKNCDYNCPVHKLATHNACLTCSAVRNSPHHDLKNVTDEELQKIIKDAEAEMEE